MGYTKLFNEIIMSTIWREPNHVRILWVTMLAIKDRYHVVNASTPGLSDAARISLNECEQALEILSSPDSYSRTKDNEGRRIKKCEGGWIILNGEVYRNKMSLDERREYNRLKQKEYRERDKAIKGRGSVKSCVQSSTQCIHTDTDTDTKDNIIIKPLKQKYSKEFELMWSGYPDRAGSNPKKRAFKAWLARIKEGASEDAMAKGVSRYKVFAKETGKIGSEFVMQAATFLGADENFNSKWDLPKQNPEDIRPRNDSEWIGLGKSINVLPNTGESMPEYIKRINLKLRGK